MKDNDTNIKMVVTFHIYFYKTFYLTVYSISDTIQIVKSFVSKKYYSLFFTTSHYIFVHNAQKDTV